MAALTSMYVPRDTQIHPISMNISHCATKLRTIQRKLMYGGVGGMVGEMPFQISGKEQEKQLHLHSETDLFAFARIVNSLQIQ